ncbi:hypothetical protein RB601_000346 [Gaeumannomyces tritici]
MLASFGGASSTPRRKSTRRSGKAPEIYCLPDRDTSHLELAPQSPNYPIVYWPSNNLPEVSPPSDRPEKQVATSDVRAADDQGSRANMPGPQIAYSPPLPWWRQRGTWLMAAGVMVLIIGGVLGSVLGLIVLRPAPTPSHPPGPGGGPGGGNTTTTTTTADAPKPPPTGTSKCSADAICTDQVAAVTTPLNVGEAGENLTVYLFARAADGSWQQASSAPGGGSYRGGWVSRGGEKFDRHPVAIGWIAGASSWGGGPTATVLGVSPTTKKLLAKHVGLGPGPGTATWIMDISYTPKGYPAQNHTAEAPGLCAVGTSRVDVWTRVEQTRDVPRDVPQNRTGPVLQHKWAEEEKYWTGTPLWEDSAGGFLVPNSRFSVVCRDIAGYHDMVVYGNGTEGNAAWHRQFDRTAWRDWQDLGGDYMPGTHPVLLEVSSQRFDFFGLGRDRHLYHWSWTSTTAWSVTEMLGDEKLVSLPAVAVSGAKKESVEVVAVGADGRLKHLSFRADTSSVAGAKWEDLGMVASSVPSLARVGSSGVEMVTTAADGSIWYATVDVTKGDGWTRAVWKPVAS